MAPTAALLVERLRAIVGTEAVLSRPDELFVYECDGLTLGGTLPDAVVLPRDGAEVAAVGEQGWKRVGPVLDPTGPTVTTIGMTSDGGWRCPGRSGTGR